MPGATLWLFDIDGTLVDTGGAGLHALEQATKQFFGAKGPALDLAGATDSGLVAGLFRHFDREPVNGEVSSYYELYLSELEGNLSSGRYDGRVLPGAVTLLNLLADRQDVTVGLLTGNIEDGALAKMRHYGLDHHFAFGAYGCDFADRNKLGPVALQRAAKHAGRAFTPEETLVIGDTPKDIACAAAMGARCLAVATGSFDEAGLVEADRVAASLEDEAAWRSYL